MRAVACFVVVTAVIAGCSSDRPATVQSGEAFLAAHVAPEATIEQTEASLRRAGATVMRVDPTACAVAYLGESLFRCAGGPALYVTLNESIQPWHPFVRPSLNAFLSYDSSGHLAHSVVTELGGDQ